MIHRIELHQPQRREYSLGVGSKWMELEFIILEEVANSDKCCFSHMQTMI